AGIRVRLPRSYKTDLDTISHIVLTGTNGLLVPLGAIATISRTTGQAELDREGFRSYVAVTARLENRDLGSTMADIKKTIKRLHIPPGIQIEYGGVYETEQESFQNLLVVAIAALLLVSLVLLIEFRMFSVPIMIVGIAAENAIFILHEAIQPEVAKLGRKEALLEAARRRSRPIIMTTLAAILALLPLAAGYGQGAQMQQPLAIAVIGGFSVVSI